MAWKPSAQAQALALALRQLSLWAPQRVRARGQERGRVRMGRLGWPPSLAARSGPATCPSAWKWEGSPSLVR